MLLIVFRVLLDIVGYMSNKSFLNLFVFLFGRGILFKFFFLNFEENIVLNIGDYCVRIYWCMWNFLFLIIKIMLLNN